MTLVRPLLLSTAFTLLTGAASAAVSGRVVSLEGAPVGRATVEAYAQETAAARAVRIVEGRSRTPLASVRSAADGSFRVEAAGAVLDLEASADGFAPAFQTLADAGPITLVLQPAKVRRGVVVADGKPVSSALVVWVSGRGFGDALGEVLLKTGQDGAYEVPDPDVWATSLVVLHPDRAPLEAYPEMAKWPNPLSHTLSAGVPIEGTVVDEATGRGLVGATLWVGAWPLARSSGHGEFRISHAPPGWRAVVAVGKTLVGLATPTAGPIRIAAQPARSLSGFVRDSKTSRPLGGAVVWVRGERTNVTLTTTTDVRGWYSFPALAAERLMASADLPGYSSVSEERETDTVDLRKGGPHQRDFSLVRDRRLVGRVQDEQRKPVDNAIVLAGSEGDPRMYVLGDWMVGHWMGRGRPTARTGPDGSFALTLPSELKHAPCVFALKEGYAAGRSEAVDLDAEPARLVVVTLTRGVELRGRVVAPDGTPLPDVAVVLAEDGVLQEYRVPVAVVLASWGGPGWTKTNAAGEFVTRVQPTAHALAFHKSGFLSKVVQRQEPTPDSGVDVVLDPAVDIRGRVVRSDATGVAGVGIYTMNRSYVGRSAHGITDGDGGFVLADLAPGRYELYIGKAQTGIEERRTVEAPSSDVFIELGPTATLRGRVVDAKNHDPIPQFTLSLRRESADESPSPVSHGSEAEVSDAEGAFEISDVAAGEWTVTVSAQGYAGRDVEGVQVATEGDVPPLEITLDKGAVLHGHVGTRGGQPLADVKITANHKGDDSLFAESDENGDFELAGLPPGGVKLDFRHEGYLSERRTVDAAQTNQLDIVLSRGLAIKGTVVSGGMGVPNASVEASSAVPGAESQRASTGRDGSFTMEGLAAGRYSFEASAEGKGDAKLEDVDVTSGAAVRLVLQPRETAILSGTMTGLPENDDLMLRMVTVEGEDGKAETATADGFGHFRMENAPVGLVKVRGYARSLGGKSLASRTSELTLAAGTESQTVLEFRTDLVVTGTVTLRGAPLPDASVSFQAADGGDDSAMTTTGTNGAYEIVGIEPGPYTVHVYGLESPSYETEYFVNGSGQLDIDVTGTAVRGQVVDAATREPIPQVEVSFWFLGGRENTPATSVTTNARGEFNASSLREGRYRLLTAKQGYGQETREVELSRGATAEVGFDLVAAEGLSVKVTDARDGRPLDAIVVVRDSSRRIVANRHSDPEADGVFTIPLSGGSYLLSVSASGYGTRTLPVTAPGQGIAVTLTPGGTLVVQSERNLHGRIRLVQPDGEEYVRCWCNGIADIQLSGRRTTVPNVTAGNYSLELLDHQGSVFGGSSISIQEGQTTTVKID